MCRLSRGHSERRNQRYVKQAAPAGPVTRFDKVEYAWRSKLRRAEQHLREFNERCNDYLTTANVGFEYETVPTAGHIHVRLRADHEPPMSLGVVVGDVLHNLRSALDAIAWEACQRAGVPPAREADVYFPIGLDPKDWRSLAGSKLPGLSSTDRAIFKELQPWYHRHVAQSFGVEMDADVVPRHPLARLNDLAKRDRHRVPHPILARAGDTWIGSPEDVVVELEWHGAPPWVPGDVVLTWRVIPADRVADASPAGSPILAFTEDAALAGQSCTSELGAMRQSVTTALRIIEVQVLHVVTTTQLEELAALQAEVHRAEERVTDFRRDRAAIIDESFVKEHSRLMADLESARNAYSDKWRELFE